MMVGFVFVGIFVIFVIEVMVGNCLLWEDVMIMVVLVVCGSDGGLVSGGTF